MSRLLKYVFDAVRRPREQLSRGQHFVRHSWELAVHCYRQLKRHRADGMAAELTYRTIFSLIPVVVLGLVTFRIVGGLEEVQSKVENQLFSFFGVPEIPADYLRSNETQADANTDHNTLVAKVSESSRAGESPAAGGSGSASEIDMEAAIAVAEQSGEKDDPPDNDLLESNPVAQVDPAETQREARASIRRTLRMVTGQVVALDFKSIGVFGLLLFLYAAVTLANATEQLFNRIYDAPAQRPVHIRLAIHWSMITLGSGLLAMSLYMSGQFVEWSGTVGAGSSTRMYLSHFLSIAASWVLLFLLYALMPNTRVSVRAAVVGALVGSLLWEAAKFGFQVYVIKAVPYSAIYGSLGLLPLFLFWVYLTWLIILFGLILTYTLQTLGSRWPPQHDEDTLSAGDPDWMLPIMSESAHAFESGDSLGNQGLADRLGLPARVVHEMTSKLVDAAMLRRVSTGAGDEDTLTLARPADKIGIAEILELAHRVGPTSDHPAWRSLAHLKQAERAAAAGKTLADLASE